MDFYSQFLCCLICCSVFSNAQLFSTPCQTPYYEAGQCVRIKYCGYAIELLLSQDPFNIKYLQSLVCGYDAFRRPKVCCLVPSQPTYFTINDLLEYSIGPATERTHGREWQNQEPSSTCVTIKNEQGECINIKKCKSALKLLRSKDPTDISYLRSLQCGLADAKTPKVCCVDETLDIPKPPDVSNHPNIGKINRRKCGSVTTDKVVGGNKTKLFEYPWMALISYTTNVGREFKCGGTVINEGYVLTAAHCLTNLMPGIALAGVRLGEHNIATKQDCQKIVTARGQVNEECAPEVQDIKIEKTVVHPQYNPENYSTPDIGLIKLRAKADFSRRNIGTICLPVDGLGYFNGSMAIVAGWGTTETGRSSDVLLQVQLPIISNSECRNVYKTNPVITHKQLCAGGQASEGHDACGGDSGGPLMYPEAVNDDTAFVQHGIVSFGPRFCGFDNRPGVYTRVGYFMDWILDNLN